MAEIKPDQDLDRKHPNHPKKRERKSRNQEKESVNRIEGILARVRVPRVHDLKNDWPQ